MRNIKLVIVKKKKFVIVGMVGVETVSKRSTQVASKISVMFHLLSQTVSRTVIDFIIL